MGVGINDNSSDGGGGVVMEWVRQGGKEGKEQRLGGVGEFQWLEEKRPA